jgi:CRISPR-associated protein Csh1
MEQNETILSPTEEIPNEYGQRIELFFKQMSYNNDQKAMFHLGRMLNAVAYIQKDKNKNVLEKVNFSGLDKSDILRLRNSLMEKAQQYNKVDKVIFSDANFSEHFNYNNWKMKPEESVFFLLSGYSFGLIKN